MWGNLLGRSMGRKLSNMAYSHGSLKFLSSFNYKNLRFLELEIKRNRLKNTRLMYIVFVCFYFGEKNATLKAAQGRDCRPSQQGFRTKWKEKIRWINV